MTESILAWHFLPSPVNGVYRTQHTQEVVCVMGTLRVEGPIKLCKRGLHASQQIIDALSYSPGPIVCRVRMSGTIIDGYDKLVASERTVIALADISTILHEFACDCAERALMRERDAGREPDPRSWAAIEAKRKWMRGEMSDDELKVARAAAHAAAHAAAYAAANAAAHAAAKDAKDSAYDAANAAAKDAERYWQNETLTQRVMEVLQLI